MYFSPKLYDTSIQIKVYTDTGAEVTDFSSTSIVLASIGYYTNGTYSQIKSLTSLITPLEIETLDIEKVYCQITTATYTQILKVENLVDINKITYSFIYTVDKSPIKTSNMLIDRCNFFMPRWSAAYRNDLSTFNKVYYPIYEQLEKVLTRSYSALTSNLSGKPSAYNSVPLRKTPLTIMDKDTSVKLEEVFNIDLAIINSAKLAEVSPGILLDSVSDTIQYPIELDKNPAYIFAKKINFGQSVIHIEGLNTSHNYVQETLTVTSREYVKSLVKYSRILNITTDNTDISITTYINCKDTVSYKPNDSLRLLVDSSKSFSTGFKMAVTSNNVLEISEGIFDKELPLYRYSLNIPSPINNEYNLFVTPQNNLILLHNNALYSGVLSKPLDSFADTQDIVTNSIVTVECDEDTVGESFTFVVDFKEYYKDFIGNDFYIKLQTNGEVLYLNQDKQFQSEMTLYTVTGASKLYLDLTLEANKVYVLSLMDGYRTFSAIMRVDSVDFVKVLDLQSIVIPGENLYMYHNGENLIVGNTSEYSLTLSKDYYEWCSGISSLYIPNNIKNIEVVYTDFSKDIITI